MLVSEIAEGNGIEKGGGLANNGNGTEDGKDSLKLEVGLPPSTGQEDQEAGGSGDKRREGGEVKDSKNLVYLIMLLHGIGILLPWNMLINAQKFFEDYKLGPEYTGVKDLAYRSYFLSGIILLYQIPTVFFNWVNIFVKFGGHLHRRIMSSLAIEGLIFIMIIIVSAVDTSSSPEIFFWVMMLCSVVVSTFAAIYQNSLYGIGAKLGYIAPLVLGSNISGTFTSILSLISMGAAPSEKSAAMFYFGTAIFIIIMCLLTYGILPLLKFYQFRVNPQQNRSPSLGKGTPRGKMTTSGDRDSSEIMRSSSCGVLLTPPMAGMLSQSMPFEAEQEVVTAAVPPPPPPAYLQILKKCWPQCFNVFMVFFVTLSLFPSVLSQIKMTNEHFFLGLKYFTGVVCFLTFNFFAMLGNLIPNWKKWPGPDKLWIGVTLRLLFIPFYLLCDYQPLGYHRSDFGTWLFNDWIYWLGNLFFGLSSGYFSSLAMIYCPEYLSNDEDKATAAMFSVAFLVTGLSFGVALSYLMPYLIIL